MTRRGRAKGSRQNVEARASRWHIEPRRHDTGEEFLSPPPPLPSLPFCASPRPSLPNCNDRRSSIRYRINATLGCSRKRAASFFLALPFIEHQNFRLNDAAEHFGVLCSVDPATVGFLDFWEGKLCDRLTSGPRRIVVLGARRVLKENFDSLNIVKFNIRSSYK